MKLSHRIEAAAARAALSLLRALGPVRASNLCGRVARWVGPLLPVSRIAHTNLRLAMPELDQAARRRIVRGVWENLGRTVGELPHVGGLRETASGPGWEFADADRVRALAQEGGPAVLFTGHIGNWEVLPKSYATMGVPFATVYRAADNKLIDALIRDMRLDAQGGETKLFPKGSQGARQALAHLRAHGYVGMVVDQKMNDGIQSRFLGQPAMSAPAPAALALRLRCTLASGYAKRIGPARFRVFSGAPIPLPDSGDRAADVALLTQRLNDEVEGWIRDWPEGWLWLHRRFPKALYR